MKLDIVQIGHPVLRQKAHLLTLKEIHSKAIQTLIQDMKETMYAAPGVGLAAPQIGESIQLVTIEDQAAFHVRLTKQQLKERERVPVPFHVMINPTLTIIKKTPIEFYEGCLSVAGFVGSVPRALEVNVECLNEKGEPTTLHARGWYARILQHEIDHLHGCLCVDRMKIESLSTLENYMQYWLK